MTLSFRATTDTQLTKLEEEAEKTRAAAEAGIEKAIGDKIQSGTNSVYAALDLGALEGIDLDQSSVQVTATSGNSFVSPLMERDQQYTFYLADYENNTFSNPYSGSITLYYGSEATCNQTALELTVISGAAPYAQAKYIADSAGGIITNPAGTGVDNKYNGAGATILGTAFACKTSAVAIPPDAKLLFVRILGNRSRLGFVGDVPLRSQGKFIISEAVSETGLSKKIQLFQSLPQIPAEFFVTGL